MINNSTLQYETAEVLPLPNEKEFFAVEYPGYVKNIDKVLNTLGGQHGLQRALKEDCGYLELRYRPGDHFSHPINGDVIHTGNLLLKVTRRVRRRKGFRNAPREEEQCFSVENEEESNFNAEIVGVISKTCRFRGMADYQYLPDPVDPIAQFRNSLQSLDVEKICKFPVNVDCSMSKTPNLPPPSFSRIECPMDYGYRQNTSVVKVLVQKNEDEPPIVKLINRRRRRKFVAYSIDFEAKSVPNHPPEDAVKFSSQIPQESIENIQALFDRRPMWTRSALQNNLPANDRKIIKRLLPFAAYWMSSGPWRDCWIKYGYDPRQHVDARFYQLLDIRYTARPRQLGRAKRLLRAKYDTLNQDILDQQNPDNIMQEDQDSGEQASGVNPDRSHIFDGKNKQREVAVYQMCDISYPRIKKLVESKEGLRKLCDEKDGWFSKQLMDFMRKSLRRKIASLARGEETDPEEDVPLQLDGNEEAAENGSDSGGEVDKTISSKVDQLMRNLQLAQLGTQDHDDEFEQEVGLYQLDDMDEYENVFGDDEDVESESD
ncbi:tau 95 subunit of transcription factor TFIIIC [Basidiobolus ranarum]|uniref:Tau 95 subunit of transcription factor TFIIIC n=1 Tax=Basidiobolus ranarum TaxID=34480 RepID=A0ABR2X4C8_9FUNG